MYRNEKILVVGACGQIGTDLTLALRNLYGDSQVIAADLKDEVQALHGTGPFISLDIMDRQALAAKIRQFKVTQVYLLAAMLSATGERYPHKAWQLNMQSLLYVLEVAREEKVAKIFWPSSIAVFGSSAPRFNCPQNSLTEPSTVYGISKQSGEQWCAWYNRRFGIDVRSLRYPGLISHLAEPGGGTTDYAVDIFHEALRHHHYQCFLNPETCLPMMYMPDAIRATIELMDAPGDDITVRHSYNISAMSFSPEMIAKEIRKHLPEFQISYKPDERQAIADSWPGSIDDSRAQADWKWKSRYDMPNMVTEMISHLKDFNLAPQKKLGITSIL